MSVKHQSVCFFRTEHDKTSPAWWESPSSQRTGGVYVAWRAAGLLTQLSSNSPAATESNQSGLLLMNSGTSSGTGCSLQTSCLLPRWLLFFNREIPSVWTSEPGSVTTWSRGWERQLSAVQRGCLLKESLAVDKNRFQALSAPACTWNFSHTPCGTERYD